MSTGEGGGHGSKGDQKRLICIVDDDKSSRRGLRFLVRSLGYEAVSFASGEAFLASGLVPDTACLISDVMMPGMDGFALHARLGSDGHAIPTVFVTGLDDESILRRATDAGAVGLLVKPCNQELLIAYLDRAFAAYR